MYLEGLEQSDGSCSQSLACDTFFLPIGYAHVGAVHAELSAMQEMGISLPSMAVFPNCVHTVYDDA